MPLIDSHTHTHPTAQQAQAFLANFGLPATLDGTPSELTQRMDAAAIEWTMIVSFLPIQQLIAQQTQAGVDRDEATATMILRWHDLNSWAAAAASADPARIKCVVGVDPVVMSREQVANEVRTQLESGASGIKIAPMFLGVPPDDEAVEVVWQLAVEHDVPVLSESGAGDGSYPSWGHPKYFAAVLDSYPRLRLQLAHLGLGAEDIVAQLARSHDNVITDTALRFGGVGGTAPDVTGMLELIRSVGVDCVAFGTNYPIVDQVGYATALRELGLTESELRRVGHDNAARLWRTPQLETP
jgi:uncharacterized protein